MPSKRVLCPKCDRPEQRCLCPFITPTDNRTFTLILQHPDETAHAKNTGELLHRSLTHSQLLIGEQFNPAQLEAYLQDAVLLYPPTDDGPAANTTTPDKPQTLIVIDANWRKSRKMLFLNPTLAKLPRLSLSEEFSGNYRIRKAKNNWQLSTLEASCYALQQLENCETTYRPLLDSFDQFMDKLVGFDPNRSKPID